MARLCICGHPKIEHVDSAGSTIGGGTGWRCIGNLGRERPPYDCQCEGYQAAARRGERLVFGVHRINRRQAESAPAWPPLEDRGR